MLLAQLRLPGGRISTLLVPPSLSGAQLLQRALLELLRCRLQQPVSGEEEGAAGAPPTLAELERLLVLRVAGTFDFIDGEASLLSLRCAASCAAEHRPLQLRLMPRAAALAWLYGLPRASALVAADEGAARPPPQPHVLGADASVLPAVTAGELFVPFVFTPDFAAVIGGRDSPAFAEFIRVCGAAFNVLRSHSTS